MFRATALAVLAFARPAGAADPPTFERDVKPLLVAKCVNCHGGDSTKSGLDLRTAAAAKRGRETGPSVVPGNPAKRLLCEQIESGAMPPGKAAKFTPAEVAVLKAWIEGGALAEQVAPAEPTPAASTHWAFRSPVRPAVPSVPGTRHPIDASRWRS